MALVPIFLGNYLPLGVEVTAIETITVSAGTFKCFKVELSPLQSVYWISTDNNRYPVKFEDQGIHGELAEIAHRSPDEAVAYQDPWFDFSLTVPAGWYHRRHAGTGRNPQAKEAQVLFFDPDADLKFGTLEVRPAKAGWTLKMVAERELEGVKRRFKDYTLRPESWQERDIAGSPAISFAGDYKEGKEDYVQYRVYMLNDLKLEFIFRVAADRFAGRNPQAKEAQVLFFDPDADLKFGTLEVRPAKAGWTLKMVAERELEGVKRRFKDYTLRPESWQERDIAGSPAISFAGDYKEGKEDYVQYRVYMLNDLKLEFIFRVAADRFDEFLPVIDSIVSSLRTE